MDTTHVFLELAAKMTKARTENFERTELSSHHALAFSPTNDIGYAFTKLSDSIKSMIKSSNFNAMQQACVEQIKSPVNRFPESLISRIKRADKTFDDLFLTLSESDYWNFLDIRMMEAMVTASMVPAAQQSLENFKKTFFSMKLDEVELPELPLKLNHTILKEVLYKDPKQLTIASLSQHHLYLENMLETALSCCKIMMGSPIIEWQIHIDHAYRVHSLLNKIMATLSLEGISELFIPNGIKWEGLPFTWIGQEEREIGPIQPVTDEVQREPYSLPDGFEWIFISSETPEVEIYKTCLELNNMIRSFIILLFFRFPSSKLLVIKSLPHTTGYLIKASLLGMTQSVKIKGKLLKIAYINFIRSRSTLDNVSIKEMMRRFQLDGIYQALIFMTKKSTEIVKPVVTLTLWTFSLNKMNLLLYSTPQTAGLRKMTSKDIPSLLAVFDKYTSRFEISSAIQSEEECSLFFLPLQTNGITIITYVVDDPISGEITDMFSFKFFATSNDARVAAILQTRTPPKQLIIDLLLCAMQEKKLKKIRTFQFGLKSEIFEEVQRMTSMLAPSCKGMLPIYLYNYSYPEVDEDDFYLIRI